MFSRPRLTHQHIRNSRPLNLPRDCSHVSNVSLLFSSLLASFHPCCWRIVQFNTEGNTTRRESDANKLLVYRSMGGQYCERDPCNCHFLLSVNDPKPLNSFCPVRLTTDTTINDRNIIIIISGHGWKDHFEKLISRNIFLCRSWHHSLAITRVSSVTHESS